MTTRTVHYSRAGATGASTGTNLLDGTNFVRGVSAWENFAGTVVAGGAQGQKSVYYDNSSGTSYANVLQQVTLDGSTSRISGGLWYTLSFWVRGSGSLTTYFYPGTVDYAAGCYADGEQETATEDGARAWTLSSSWTEHTYTFRTLVTITDTQRILFRAMAGCTLYVSAVKLELGDTATDWCLSESDKTGRDGAVLRGPQAWSDCAVGYNFQAGGNDDTYLDCVIYNDNYYTCKTDHVKTEDNYPGSTEDTNEGYWQLGDKVSLIATNILLSAYALIKNLGAEAIEMKDSDGNIIFEAKDGNVTCKTGIFENVTISGTLKGVSGTFKSLQCADSDGNVTGEIAFGEQSGIYFNYCDIHQQGGVDGRTLRHYAADIRCRGLIGIHQHSVAVITGSSIKYYVNGADMSSYVTKTMSTVSSSDGHTVYMVPVYPSTGDSATGNCKVGDTNGFPVDVILINNTSGTYYYELDGGIAGKTVTIVNVNNQLDSIYIANNNAWRNLNGGAVHQYLNIDTYRSPSISTSTIGYAWICISAFDNDWS